MLARKRSYAGEVISEEAWVLPANCEAQWQVDESGGSSFLRATLRFVPDPTKPEQVAFDEVVVAMRLA